MGTFTIYQGYYDEVSQARLSRDFQPLDIRSYIGNPYFEFSILRDLHRSSRPADNAWGLVSSKFGIKTAITSEEFAAFVGSQLATHDAVFVNPMIFWEAVCLNVWEQGEICHPEMIALASRVTGISGLERLVMKRDSFAFCNYFVARNNFWDAYIDFVNRTVVERFEAGNADRPLVSALARTAGHAKNPAANYVPFVIERLFSTFVLLNPQFRVSAFVHPVEIYVKKFGVELGTMLHAISLVKESIAKFGDEGHQRFDEFRLAIHKAYGAINMAALDDPT